MPMAISMAKQEDRPIPEKLGSLSPILENSNGNFSDNEVEKDSSDLIHDLLAEDLDGREHFLTTNDPYYWLTDLDIKAATQLMKKAFPKIGGLNYTVLGSHWNFAKPEQVPWIQVIRDSDRRHWLVATSKDGKSAKIYDSMQGTKGLNQHVVGCVSALVRPTNKSFTYQQMSSQKQLNGYDCRVYAIAFAVAICNNQNPSDLHFDGSLMRQHLKECLKRGQISSFPPSIRWQKETFYECNSGPG